MNEAHYYNSIAIVTHSGYATMKRYRAAAGGSWETVYHMLRENPALIPEYAPPLPDPGEAYEHMESFGIRLVLDSQKEFPDALRNIPSPPFGIYFRNSGHPAKAIGIFPAASETLAIVGTRRASAEGKNIARMFARETAAAGFTIASGLAFGIDGAAHEGALDAHGTTIAILAGGLDGIYPHSHRALAERIFASGGMLVSEYPPGEAPLAYRFIERNRIMSGLSRGVLIVEAPENSGALATARYAVEQDRDVFVVPGAITSSRFTGSHALIRQGAELVTAPDDILNAYEIDKKKNVFMYAGAASPEEILVLKALADISTPADVDKLVAATKLEPRMVNRALGFLLIRGMIRETDAGYTI